MKYLSVKDISIKWNKDPTLVLRLCKSGRITGAIKIGRSWAIPIDSIKPIDKRTKAAKKINNEVVFRFPLYVNFKEEDYNLSLTYEEKCLRDGEIKFHKFEFKEAKEIFKSLLENSSNRYISIACLYHLAEIYKLENDNELNKTLFSFNALLAEDFPYKKEMKLFKYYFDMNNSYYKSIIDDFDFDCNYNYHPSCYFYMSLICLIPIAYDNFSLANKLRYESQELLCRQMENDGYYLEAQIMSFYLLLVYHLKNNEDKMLYYASKGIELAYKYNLYINAGYFDRYYPKITNSVLKKYPKDFINTILSISKMIKTSEEKYASQSTHPSYLGILSENDFELAFIANQGYNNKEIATKLHISEKVVSKRYNEIYDKLNVKNKHELIELINNTHRNGVL